MAQLRPRIEALVVERLDVPLSDVIVNLLSCPYLNPDPKAADLVLYLETSPGETIETQAPALCHALARLLAEFELTADPGAEVWVRFVSGSWCLIVGTAIQYATHEEPTIE
jgi:hypothetical protein